MRRSIKKVAAGLLATMMIGTMLTGCGGGNKKDSGSSKKETSEINIGFSQVGAESDWRVANTKSMKSALTAKNGFKLSFADAQQKQENQTKAVREFITQGVDVIAIAPVTETGWETVLKEAKKADIPVITVDRQIKTSDDSLITAWVGSDFKKEGVKAAEWLIKEKGKEKGDVTSLYYRERLVLLQKSDVQKDLKKESKIRKTSRSLLLRQENLHRQKVRKLWNLS